jgi:hypothetical protein
MKAWKRVGAAGMVGIAGVAVSAAPAAAATRPHQDDTVDQILARLTPHSNTSCNTGDGGTVEVCAHVEGSGQDITADYGTIFNKVTEGSITFAGHIGLTGPSIAGTINSQDEWIAVGQTYDSASPPDGGYPANYTNSNAAAGNYCAAGWGTSQPDVGPWYSLSSPPCVNVEPSGGGGS